MKFFIKCHCKYCKHCNKIVRDKIFGEKFEIQSCLMLFRIFNQIFTIICKLQKKNDSLKNQLVNIGYQKSLVIVMRGSIFLAKIIFSIKKNKIYSS